MVEVTYQMVLSTLQTTGILVGIFYYIMTLNNTRKSQRLTLESRQAQLFMQMLNARAYMEDSFSSESLQH